MGMNLYEINSEILKAVDEAVDPDTGEIINEEAYERLNELQIDSDTKVENILLWIKDLKAEATAYKNEKMSFDAKQKQAEHKAESLTKYVENFLNGQKFKTDRVAVSYRKSEVVEYNGNIFLLPDDCIRVRDPEVDKTKLKEHLKAGETIEGATLVEKQNIQIK